MNKRGVFNFLPSLFKGKQKGNCYEQLSSIRVNDMMIKDVLCSQRNEKLIDAAHIMIGAHASCLVVLEGEKPIGIITERDFVKKLSMDRSHSSDMLVNDVMTKQLFTASHGMSLVEAQKIMKAHSFRKLVIVENEKLRGIITQTDLCWAVADMNMDFPNPPTVRSVMSRRVLTVSEDDKFAKAKKLMASNDIGSVLVVEKGAIKGIFTEFDLVSEFFMNPNRLRNSFMKDLMTSPIVCITPDFDIFTINKIMLKRNFRRLPVLENNKVVGIITQTDVARGMYDFIEKHKDSVCGKKPSKKGNEPDFTVRKEGSIIVYELKKEEPKAEAANKKSN
jgi:CBS domain-containing protein